MNESDNKENGLESSEREISSAKKNAITVSVTGIVLIIVSFCDNMTNTIPALIAFVVVFIYDFLCCWKSKCNKKNLKKAGNTNENS